MGSFVEAFGLIVVAPLWGMISTMLFFRSIVSVIRIGIYGVGLSKGTVPRKKNISGLMHSLSLFIIYVLVLVAGFLIMSRRLPFEWEKAEKVVYWIFCGLAAFYSVPRIPEKLRRTWRYATVPGALEEEVALPEETVVEENNFVKPN